MRRLDPYLWLHLWGVAITPLALAGCLAALAVGDPWGPPGLEVGILALVGTVPVVWLQGRRPWYPFTLGPCYLRPVALTLTQRQLLARSQAAWRAAASGLLALGMVMVLEGLYRLAPVVSGVLPWIPWSRPVAWTVALGCFLGAHWTAQVGLAGVGLLLGRSPRPTDPALTPEAIPRRFTYVGIPIPNLFAPHLLAPEPVEHPDTDSAAAPAEPSWATTATKAEPPPESSPEAADLCPPPPTSQPELSIPTLNPMSHPYDFDLFVIGAGSGGIASARRAAQYGAKVGIAESWTLGGTCVNRGCVPKKLMVYASHFPKQFHAATGYGWSAVESQFDWGQLTTAVNNEVKRLNGVYQRMLDNSQVTIFPHHARFIDAHTLQVGEDKVTADKILIAVGGEPVKPNLPGIEHTITSDDIFHLPSQPQRMVILGGGYIGCEFACILNGLGTEVTQIIRSDQILRGFDQDIRDEIQATMVANGIRILTQTTVAAIEKGDAGVTVRAKTPDGEETVVADAVALSALGRRPKLEGLGLENVGVEVVSGAIAVDAYSRTAEPNIWAVGDCTDRMNLTPVAINEGRAFADTEFGGNSRALSYENIPTAVFTTPEAATVGLTEAEAIARYGADGITVYRSKFRPMYYTLPDLPVKTLMKLIVHKQSDRVIGAHMVGDDAAEIIQGVAIALKTGATKANFDATVGIHPSAAEEFVTMR